MKNENKKHSPLKITPLRSPGQSLEEKFNDILYVDMMMRVLFIFFVFSIAFYDWTRIYFNAPPHPLTWFIIGVGISIYYYKELRNFWKELKNTGLGINGEKTVGQSLEYLRSSDYKVFHDIVTEKGNIDHVIVGPGGVFTVETKTRSILNEDLNVIFNGIEVIIDGFSDKKPITQARGEAYWLEKFISKNAKMEVKVKPIVIYPGRFVKQIVSSPDIWVLNEKALPSYLANERVSLSSENIALLSSLIGNYNRNQD